jgi:hypothetical protein
LFNLASGKGKQRQRSNQLMLRSEDSNCRYHANDHKQPH